MIFNILSKKLLKAAWVACNTLFFARLIQCKFFYYIFVVIAHLR